MKYRFYFGNTTKPMINIDSTNGNTANPMDGMHILLWEQDKTHGWNKILL